LVVLAACDGLGGSPDAEVLPDCGRAVAPIVHCGPEAVLAADRFSLDLGTVAVSSRSSVFSIAITNVGRGRSGGITANAVGPEAAEFDVSDGCDALEAMGTCTVAVVFKPSSPGMKSSRLLVSSAPGGTIEIALTGVATM